VNAVRQREFDQHFGFRDYSTVTGHATWYWDTGWHDTLARISVGRYLARDIGATIDISRTFRNGVSVGAFMTRTNVSAAQFGEGSFDKGVYLSIPFDAMMTRSSATSARFLWRPLTRDGGAKLVRAEQLYDITGTRDDRTLWREAAPKPNEQVTPADRREEWQPRATLPGAYVGMPSRPSAAAWERVARFEHELVQALYAQRFRNVEVRYDASHRLIVQVSNPVLRPASLAVGRAARTALRHAPLEIRELHVTLLEGTHPLVRYEFVDLPALERFLTGSFLTGSDLAVTHPGMRSQFGRGTCAASAGSGQGATDCDASRQDLTPSLGDSVKVVYLESAAAERDPIALLRSVAALDAEQTIPETLRPVTRPLRRAAIDAAEAVGVAADTNWWRLGAIGAGAVLASAVLDRRGYRFATDHAGAGWLKAGVKAGDALPWVGMGLAGLAALDGSDPRRSRTGYAAVEAGAVAFLGATGLKYAFGRARPDANPGPSSFDPFSSSARNQSFPSRHAATAWAVVTPFAREYDAGWLYGAAAITTLARVGSREHWVSDSVAGSLLGYAIGRIFWESSRAQSRNGPRVLLEKNGIKLGWALE